MPKKAKQELVPTVKTALHFALANLHTITIAKVTAVSAKKINCRPVINRLVNGEERALPEFTEVPPIFMQGGGSYTAHPIAVDDYCLLLITERCYDRWYNGADFQLPPEFRMHDYSDGFALVGINNLAGAITIPDVITQIGDTYQDGNYEHLGDVEQTGNYDLTGSLDVSGNTDSGTYSVNAVSGWTGTFATGDARTVTVTSGLIVDVSQ